MDQYYKSSLEAIAEGAKLLADTLSSGKSVPESTYFEWAHQIWVETRTHQINYAGMMGASCGSMDKQAGGCCCNHKQVSPAFGFIKSMMEQLGPNEAAGALKEYEENEGELTQELNEHLTPEERDLLIQLLREKAAKQE